MKNAKKVIRILSWCIFVVSGGTGVFPVFQRAAGTGAK